MRGASSTRKLRISPFDLRHTFESAQPLTFYADYDSALGSVSYVGTCGLVRATQSRNREVLEVDGTDAAMAAREVARRFRASDDMRSIYSGIGTDWFMLDAIREYRGMRLTLSDPWETTLCFIISQYNNVARIRRIVRNIIARFGPVVGEDGMQVGRRFPTSEEMAAATHRELLACGTGFRAKYIMSAADFCTNNMDLARLPGRKYDKLKESLMEIDGVGDKVADCIALMGYGNMRAFPIDVWVKRTVERVYFGGKDVKIPQIHEFSLDMWGGLRGYAQQYLFWHGRQMGR